MNDIGTGSGEEKSAVRVRLDGRTVLLMIAIALIILGGAALRVHSLSYTPYPYILDGLGEAEYAGHIAETGSLSPAQGASYAETHTVYTPAYDALLAMFSLFQGENPLFVIQKLIAPFAVLMLVGVYAIARRFSDSHRVSLVATMAMAAYGPFLLVTQASWKECMGISLIPLILLTFMLRSDPRMRLLSISLLFFIPFVHHLIAIVVVLTISFASYASFLIARRERRLRSGNVIDALVAIIAIDEMALYYSFVHFDRLQYLNPQNGLYLIIGLSILMAIAVYYMADKGLTKGGRKALVVVTSAGLIALVAMNLIAPIGTVDFTASFAFSIPLTACILIVLGGIVGISIWSTTSSEHKTLYFAMIAAPFTLVIYGLLRAEDLISLDLVTRSLDMLDLGVMIGLGTFLVFILKSRSKLAATAAVSAICVLLLLSMPIALDSEHYAATRNDIYSYEIDGLNWTASLAKKGTIQTDTLFSYTTYLFNSNDDATLVRRLAENIDLQQGVWMVASQKWASDGVKDLPFGWIKLNPTTMDSRIDVCNQVYIGGPVGEQIIVFKLP